ncbi:Mfa1 family fimbria major subunit [Phocaeicola sartorii]|uniref:Mfa1 family fimbria major subunit n=1 Tax=Phocaeicola sartorii TaxID=671267 RepID=UPI001F5A0CC6|nr:Mfa1 family fimbria major subunit [Phocaeicola sartorii]
MKFNKYYLMSALFCMALASCSDDVTEGQDGNTSIEQPESVKSTYVSFNLNFTGTSSRAFDESITTIADAEKAVKDYALFVFKNEEGGDALNTLELYATGSTQKLESGDKFKTGAYLISSGSKKVFVVVNGADNGLVLGEINKQLGEDLTINKTLLSDFEKLKFEMTYGTGTGALHNTASILGGATADLGNGLLMSGFATATLEDGVSKDDAENARNNHIEIGVDRASAKITIGVDTDDNTANFDNNLFIVAASSSTIENPFAANSLKPELGTISAVNYAMFNQNTAGFLVAHEGTVVANDNKTIFEDPNYAYDSENDLYSDGATKQIPWYYQNQSEHGGSKYVDFYTTFGDATTSIGKVIALTGTPADGSAALNPSYIPENTNAFPVKGNTTYAMLEATFVPEQTRSVDMTNPIKVASEAGSALFNQATKPISGSFLYSKEYGVFFGIDAEAGDAIPRFTADNISSIIGTAPQYANNVTAIKAIAAKMISDANVNAQTTAGGVESAAMKAKKVTIGDIVLSSSTSAVSGNAGKWLVTVESAGTTDNVGCDANAADNAKYFKITKIQLQNAASDGFESDKGDGIKTAKFPSKISTFGIYPAGKCYYRLNIQDEGLATGISPLRYAVMRNYWYQISLHSFKDLGYPNPAIAAGAATDALGADTHVSATITVKPWSLKNMKPEVGL